VIQAWKLDRLHIWVFARLEGLLDLGEILLGRDLQVLLAIDGQERGTDSRCSARSGLAKSRNRSQAERIDSSISNV
jgi:hypothetical protein